MNNTKKMLIALSLILALGAPLALADDGESFDVSGLWAKLVAFFDGGPGMDPNGVVDEGGYLDPNGLLACKGDYTACIDPNGLTTDEGSGLDPHGLTGDEGGFVDPYGRPKT